MQGKTGSATEKGPGALQSNPSSNTCQAFNQAALDATFTALKKTSNIRDNASSGSSSRGIRASRQNRHARNDLSQCHENQLTKYLWREVRKRKLNEISCFDYKQIQDIVQAIMLYYYYIEKGISSAHISSFKESWAENALALIPGDPGNLLEEIYDDVIQ